MVYLKFSAWPAFGGEQKATLRKLRDHALLALLFLALTLTQQYGFYGLKSLHILSLSFPQYLAYYLYFFVCTFIPCRMSRLFFLGFLLILNFFQMAHLSFFGSQIIPFELYLLFVEAREISGTLVQEPGHLLIPLVFTLVPLGVGGWFSARWSHFSARFLPLLLTLALAALPVRDYFTSSRTRGQPSSGRLDGFNVYLSMSYFLGKILPAKLGAQEQRSMQDKGNASSGLVFAGHQASKWDNIIVVLGETLTQRFMSLYGYERPTTPFLETLKASPNFFYTTSLSSGVFTHVSVPFFLNLTYGDAGARQIATGENCLFKLAKANGFSTHFLSTQSLQNLGSITPYLCQSNLDDFRGLEALSPGVTDKFAAVDSDGLPLLKELLDGGRRNFVVLQQRGSHPPLELRSRRSVALFHSGPDEQQDMYDNSVLEFDLYWRTLHSLLSTRKEKNLVVFLSDHGAHATDPNEKGHGLLRASRFEVPFMVHSYNQDLPLGTRELPSYIPQYSIGLYIARELGYTANQSLNAVPQDFVVYGSDVNGFAGKAEIHFTTANRYTFDPIR